MVSCELLSIIVPCYNEENNVAMLYERTNAVLSGLLENNVINGYEYVFVDDGSRDATMSEMKRLSEKDPSVYYICFTRNFGKEAAILAGLTYCRGDHIALMDADLQDPPELLPKMFAVLNNGKDYECCAARRSTRTGEPPIRSFFAHTFYKLINSLSDVQLVDGVRDFRLMTRRMVDSILLLKEKCRFSKGLFVWSGYQTMYIEYINVERMRGKTKWSFWKLFKYSLDGITAFSVVPLQIATIFGVICCFGAFLAAVYFFFRKILVGIAIEGYALLMCSLFLLGGIQLLSVGVLGQYLGKIFVESKKRPDYVVLHHNFGHCHMENQ